MAEDLRLVWDLRPEEKRLNVFESHMLAFSQFQALNTKPEGMAELLEQGRPHLEVACSLARPQVK